MHLLWFVDLQTNFTYAVMAVAVSLEFFVASSVLSSAAIANFPGADPGILKKGGSLY